MGTRVGDWGRGVSGGSGPGWKGIAEEKLSDYLFQMPVGAGMQVLHLCEPLAESISTASANDHLDALEQKAWREYRIHKPSGRERIN